MKCDKCAEVIQNKVFYEFKDKKVCDDCYIDLLIGTPEVDISKLPSEIQSDFYYVMKFWHRNRPNRHHYYKLPKLNNTHKIR